MSILGGYYVINNKKLIFQNFSTLTIGYVIKTRGNLQILYIIVINSTTTIRIYIDYIHSKLSFRKNETKSQITIVVSRPQWDRSHVFCS